MSFLLPTININIKTLKIWKNFLLLFVYNFNIKTRNVILLVFSLIFYSFGEINFLWLLILSVILNYISGILIEKNLEKEFLFHISKNL